MSGHIIERGGKYQACFPDPARPGTTHKIKRTFKLRRDAKDWLAEMRASQLAGTFVDPRKGQTLFRDVAETWAASWPNRLSPTTARRYEGLLRNYLLPEWGAVQVGRIDRAAVQGWANRLNAEGLPPATVRGCCITLRACLNASLRAGIIRTNPATGLDLPRPRRTEMTVLTAAEVRAVAGAIDPHYKVMTLAAAYTGLRAGELLALRRKDVDVLRGTLRVEQTLLDVNGVLSFAEPKTASSRRTVSLPTFLRGLLNEHLAGLRDASEDALVFPGKGGGPLRHSLFVRRHWRPVCAGYTKADGTVVPGVLPAAKAGVRWHDLRHSTASLAIQAGAHPLLVSKMLGHASVQITLDRYSHLFPDVAASLAEKFDLIYAEAEQEPARANVVALGATS